MDKGTARRKFLWIYAVILFASAFTVLIVTAFSQYKLNKNIEQYEKKLSENNSKISNFGISLTAADQEKNSLLAKITALESENVTLKSSSDGEASRTNIIKEANDNLINADSLYRSDKKVTAAQVLLKIDETALGENAKKRLDYLKLQTYEAGAKYFYKQGRIRLNEKNYPKAKEAFELSLAFDTGNYYRENSLYYMVLVSSKLEDKATLDDYSMKLSQNFPNSDYIAKVKGLQ